MKISHTLIILLISLQSLSQSWKELNDSLVHYYNIGDFYKGIEVGKKAVLTAKKEFGDRQPEYASSLDNLATLFNNIGKYEEAELLYIQSNDIWKIIGEDHPGYAASMNGFAQVCVETGQQEKAESLFIKALIIHKKLFGEFDPGCGTILNNLALLYEDIGKYEKAEPMLIRSMNIRKNSLGENNREYAQSLNNLATFYLSMGDYDKAELYSIKSTSIFKKVLGEYHPEYGRSLNNLAVIYEKLNFTEMAERLHIESVAIRKKAFGENHLYYARGLNNLGTLYSSVGKYEKAEALLLESNIIQKRELGATNVEYFFSLSNLAVLYNMMGEDHKAKQFLTQTIDLAKNIFGKSHSQYARSLRNMMTFFLKHEQFENAEPLIIQAGQIEFQILQSIASVFSEKEKSNFMATKLAFIEANNSFIYKYKKASPFFLRSSFNQQLNFKSFALSDTKNLLASIQQTKDTSIHRVFVEWKSIKSILAKQYSFPVRKRREDFKVIELRAENLEKELANKSSEFRIQQNASRISLQDVQKNLQQDEVAIEFVSFNLYNKKWTDSTIYAAYILNKRDSVPVFVPLCEEKQLQKLFDSAGTTASAMVNQFYRGLELKKKNTAGALGTELYKLIWQPLEPYLKGVKKVSYSPAGKLFSIAFHALPVDSITVLMDKYELTQYTSTRQVALRSSENQNIMPANITLFGNASFTMDSVQLVKQKINNENISTNIYTPQKRSSDNNVWNPLPGTAEEVKKTKLLFDQNKITTQSFIQTAASEENLKALDGKSPQILHIATHGFFLPQPDKKRKENNFNNENTYTLADDPLLRSGLILAGGNYAWSGKTPIDGVEDGIATAYEISQLNLSNTELVVLSACETALGDVKGSEGVFGLQRAFKMAGVKKMIVSLWQVPDKETAELMTSFYGYWMKGKTINETFAQAQADMRKKYSPFYWAAFVLVE